MDAESAADLGKLDPEAIARVREEVWPDASSIDELHDALMWLTFITAKEASRSEPWPALLTELIEQRRVVKIAKTSDAPTLTLPRDAGEGTGAAIAINPTLPRSAGEGTGTAIAVNATLARDAGEGNGIEHGSSHPFPPLAGESWDGGGLFVAVERLPLFDAAFGLDAYMRDAIPPSVARTWSREDAFIEIVRGRLEGLGPTTSQQIAESLGAPTNAIDAALLALETEGTAMRGQFEEGLGAWGLGRGEEQESDTTPSVSDTNSSGPGPKLHAPLPQWCDRRLLARIHRYTVKRLRAEIEPVQARDYVRFLFRWQRVLPDARMQGPDAVPAILAQLEGFEAAASAWETEILPARIAEYEPAWLDEQCMAGRIVWTRLATRTGDAERGAAPVRATPIALLGRRNVRLWSGFAESPQPAQLTAKARQVAEFIQMHGASFFDEIADGAGLLPNQIEEALGELVALGLVNSDSFGGLRALLIPADRRRPTARDARRKRRVAIFGMQDAGRWAMVRRGPPGLLAPGHWPEKGNEITATSSSSGQRPEASSPQPRSADADAVEFLCRTLLRRWGVVFWKVLQREASWLSPWRVLLTCLRRLEARGEIRGGRFIAGFSGEQFALPEAIGGLRDARRKADTNEYVSLSGADPLNLIGIVTPGARLPALTGNRVLYRDGVPIALYVGGEVKFLEQLEPPEQWQAQNLLLRRQVPANLSDLA
jgi:ATP-dependent Lhr-like helicase